MTTYVNIHGSQRPTVRQLRALGTVVNLGIESAAEYLYEGENGVITPAEYDAAQRCWDKLCRCLLEAEEKLQGVGTDTNTDSIEE